MAKETVRYGIALYRTDANTGAPWATDGAVSGRERELAMTAIVHREVEFYGAQLVAVRDEAGVIWVPVRRLCEAIGLNYSAQFTKLQADYVLGRRTHKMAIPDGFDRTTDMVCLDLNFVRGWLFSINANRVKPTVRDHLVRFQEQVYEVINRAFEPPPATTASAEIALSDEMIHAIMANLDQQKHLWETVLHEKQRLRAVETWVQDVDDRLSDVDRQVQAQADALHTVLTDLQDLRQTQVTLTARMQDTVHLLPTPDATINAAQKAAIKALVDDLVAAALARGVRLGQGRNDYPAVWDAFKRRFDLAKYDELSVSQFDSAIAWLKMWRDRLGEPPPIR